MAKIIKNIQRSIFLVISILGKKWCFCRVTVCMALIISDLGTDFGGKY
jgi:hypothetical protein